MTAMIINSLCAEPAGDLGLQLHRDDGTRQRAPSSPSWRVGCILKYEPIST